MKQHQPRILVTDDSPMDRRLCTGLLEGEGYQVETADDGSEALDRLRSGTFDLALLDVHMPRMTGLEVLGVLRDLPNPPPVVVLTSDTTSESVLEAIREQGFHGASDSFMNLLSPFEKQAVIGHFLRECMLEDIGRLGIYASLIEKL